VERGAFIPHVAAREGGVNGGMSIYSSSRSMKSFRYQYVDDNDGMYSHLGEGR
jgi:hypothetical protein